MTFGSTASARATSSRFICPSGSEPASFRSVPPRPTWRKNRGGALAFVPPVDMQQGAERVRGTPIARAEHDVVEHRHLRETAARSDA